MRPVLLADEVGLGKTIEAGMILHQQVLSARASRVLIMVPENLLHQWLVEMLRRFNLHFSLFDAERLAEIDADTPLRASSSCFAAWNSSATSQSADSRSRMPGGIL